MSVYHKFEEDDILSSVVITSPKIILSSGSIALDGTIKGWRSNFGESNSLSLYDGIRARNDVGRDDFSLSGISLYPLDNIVTSDLPGIVLAPGEYPAVGSINVVNVNKAPAADPSDVNETNWYQEHFNSIELLYDYYSRINPDIYFTGSYDYYSLHFDQKDENKARVAEFVGSSLPLLTDKFTMEAWINPIHINGLNNFVIQSQKNRWKLYIDGASGKLTFSDFSVTLTSSLPLKAGRWQHVMFSAGNGHATFYIDSVPDVMHEYSNIISLSSENFAIGAENTSVGVTDKWNNGFRGFIHESRIWNITKGTKIVSKEYNKILSGQSSGSANLIHYTRFNDGPFGVRHGYSQGLGLFDHSHVGIHGKLVNFNLVGNPSPSWQPNDNDKFITQKVSVNNSINTFKVIHIPSLFYGRQIATGSVQLVCNAYNRKGIVRVINDDGRGGLYMSRSIARSIGGSDYTGPKWNKVGNVFYSEGLIVITDPTLLDFGSSVNIDWSGTPDILHISFSGEERIVTKTFSCRLKSAECNMSNNPTFSSANVNQDDNIEDGLLTVVRDNVTYITAIGMYNEERKLVAVVKLAQPIRKREKDDITIRSRIDF